MDNLKHVHAPQGLIIKFSSTDPNSTPYNEEASSSNDIMPERSMKV